VTKDNISQEDSDSYTVKVQEASNGELFIELPQKLMDQLGWEAGDDVEWSKTEICEDWGEHMGFALSNQSKRFREATEAFKQAVSIDME
jgi:hypothetical protein